MKAVPTGKNASSVAKLATTGAQEEADGHYTLPGSDMKGVHEFFAENINSDIFIIDLTGKPVLTALAAAARTLSDYGGKHSAGND